jgi:hypothetical protein
VSSHSSVACTSKPLWPRVLRDGLERGARAVSADLGAVERILGLAQASSDGPRSRQQGCRESAPLAGRVSAEAKRPPLSRRAVRASKTRARDAAPARD